MMYLSFYDTTPMLLDLRLGWRGSDLNSLLTQLSVKPSSISLKQTVLAKSVTILLQPSVRSTLDLSSIFKRLMVTSQLSKPEMPTPCQRIRSSCNILVLDESFLTFSNSEIARRSVQNSIFSLRLHVGVCELVRLCRLKPSLLDTSEATKYTK